jgi:hypothetical protein
VDRPQVVAMISVSGGSFERVSSETESLQNRLVPAFMGTRSPTSH